MRLSAGMRLVLWALIVAGLLAIVPQSTEALSCPYTTEAEVFERAGTVFTATILRADPRTGGPAGVPPREILTVDIDGVRKAAVPSLQRVISPAGAYAVGGRYLLHAFPYNGDLLVGECTAVFDRQLPAAPQPSSPVGCGFVLGFRVLRDAVHDAVGRCLESEWHDPISGDALQRTSGGLLVWRKSDNFTAFTDGYRTWVAGPDGIRQRLNDERFPWEGVDRPPPLRLVGSAPSAPAVRGGWDWWVGDRASSTLGVRRRRGGADPPAVQTLLASSDAPVSFAPGARVHFAFDGPPPDEIVLSLWQTDVRSARSVPFGRTAPDASEDALGWIDGSGGGAQAGWAFVLPSRPGVYVYEVHAIWRHFYDGNAWYAFRARTG